MEQGRPSKCDEVGGLIPAYALDTLPQTEQALVDEHVVRCPDCRALLVEYEALAEGMLYTAPPVAAPPHVEADLRRRLAETRTKGAVDPIRFPRRAWLDRLFTGPARPALAATILLLLSLVASNLYWVRTDNQLRAQQSALAEELQATALDEKRLYDAVRALATGGRTVVFRGDPPALEAIATLILSPERTEAFLVLDGMPPLPTGKLYQLWLIRNGQRESGGLFPIEDEGRQVLVLQPPQPLSTYQALGVTVEPAEGSPGPTSPRVIGGRFP